MGGGSENDNFPLLYVLKMSLRRGVGGSKKAKTPLRNIKMVPYFRARFQPNMSDYEAANFMIGIIRNSFLKWRTKAYDIMAYKKDKVWYWN